MKIHMHVNYLEHVFAIEQIVARAAGAGFDGVELRGWDVANAQPHEAYLKRCCGAARAAKIDLVFGCPNDTTAAKREESLQRLKSVIRIAGEHGVKILNVFAEVMKGPQTPYIHFELNGSALASDQDFQRTADYFRDAGQFAAGFGMNLCFETHNCYIHDLATPTVRLLDLIGLANVKANFDYGNMHLNRNTLGMDREIEILRPHIGYVHLKNIVAYNHYDSRLLRGAALSEGDVNLFVFMGKLLATGYRGPITIENILPGDKRRYLRGDLDYLQSILRDHEADRAGAV